MQTPSLSRRETGVLAWADEHRTDRVDTRDIGELLGGDIIAHKTLSSLTTKGLLDRVGRGIYVVRPLRAAGGPWMVSALVAVAHLMAGSTYYVGGRTALSLHHLTSQTYGAVVDVYVPRQRRQRMVAQATIVFHQVDEDLFTFGLDTRIVEKARVVISDPERTLIDLLDRPRSLIGPRASCAIIPSVIDRIDVNKLVAYATRWPKSSTRRRLGFLLEHAGVPKSKISPLVSSLGLARTITPLYPGSPVRGPIHPIWLVATGGEK